MLRSVWPLSTSFHAPCSAMDAVAPAALDIDHRHALGKQPLAHQRGEADLPADAALAIGPHAAVAEPGHADVVAVGKACIGKDAQIDLARQVLVAAIGEFAEAARVAADDIGVCHFG